MRKLSAVLAFATAALALGSLFLWRDRNAARAQAEELQARLTELELSRADMSATQSDAAEESPVPSRASADTPSSAVTSSQPRPSAVAPAADWNARERRLLLDPNYRAARAASRRLEFASTRQELIGIVRLSPAQADEVVGYWVESELRYFEQPHPNPTNDDEMRVRMQEIEAAKLKKDSDLRAMLGEAPYAALQKYEESRQSRVVVNQLRGALMDVEALQDYQIEPLVDALHDVQSQLNDEMREYISALKTTSADAADTRRRLQEHSHERTVAANQRIHEAAATILSSRQIDALDDLLRRRLESQQARETIFRTEAESAVAEHKPAKTR